jgi:hypothetical protein
LMRSRQFFAMNVSAMVLLLVACSTTDIPARAAGGWRRGGYDD